MKRCVCSAVAIVLLFSPAVAPAQQPYVYPAKGQSAEQMSKDEYECHQWAVGSTGYDPNAASGSAPRQRGLVGGAARGAALGAIGGAIAGDAGTGAAAGAAVGAAGRLLRNRRQRVEYDHAKGAADQSFSRAYAACLEGRGYTVK